MRSDATTSARSLRLIRFWVAACLPMMISCSAEESKPPLPGAASLDTPAGNQAGPCTDGATRECHVTLGEHEGVLSCYVGTQACAAGSWEPCGDGEVRSKSGSARPLSLGPAGGCDDNPCDPSCQQFDEDPDADVVIEGGASLNDWQVGNLDDMPPGLVDKGLNEPCSTASDCQFDHYCQNPTQGSCGHALCDEGAGLDAACSPCAQKVCDEDPACCTSAYAGSCQHAPCEEGNKLKKNCDPCVKAICKVDPYCCDVFWDSICIAEVSSVCGESCAGGSGAAGDWDASCVEKVHDVCGAQCDGGGSSGQCQPYLPTQKDPECSGIDLTVGVPCEQTVPVCNRGNTTAPAGLKIVHFPGNSQQYPKCAPNVGHPQAKTCYTAEEILPGQCINVEGCPGLNGNREIVINPADGSEIAECTCENNWSLYHPGVTCDAPSCSGASSQATIKKVNLFVSVDKSGSMSWNGWTSAMNSLKAFLQDPDSAGLGVALRFWPDSSPSNCGWPSCSANACSQPLVDLADLTVDSAPADSHEWKLLQAINSRSPGGGTPMSAALAGATQWGASYQTAHPDEQAVVVLVTDGQPTECNTNINDISDYAADAFNGYGVPTYVIGIELDASTIAKVNQIASAGGTGQALLVPKNNGPNGVNQELLAAFESIRGQSVSCDFDLPNEGLFNPNDIEVVYTPSAGSPTTFTQVDGPADCGAGDWYYDDNAAPTKATLCADTCATVQNDSGAQIEVEIGCPGSYETTTYSESYSASCPAGTKVQWGYFGYVSSTPGDSSISFKARTADSEAGLGAASFVEIAAAQASPDTQVCAFGDPPCPIDLFTALGGLPAARRDHLELEIELNPSSDSMSTPALDDWNITYSCPFSE